MHFPTISFSSNNFSLLIDSLKSTLSLQQLKVSMVALAAICLVAAAVIYYFKDFDFGRISKTASEVDISEEEFDKDEVKQEIKDLKEEKSTSKSEGLKEEILTLPLTVEIEEFSEDVPENETKFTVAQSIAKTQEKGIEDPFEATAKDPKVIFSVNDKEEEEIIFEFEEDESEGDTSHLKENQRKVENKVEEKSSKDQEEEDQLILNPIAYTPLSNPARSPVITNFNWVNQKICAYGLRIQTRKDFEDGKALCALADNFVEGTFLACSKIKGEGKDASIDRLNLAFEALKKKGINQLLDAKDCVESIDGKSLQTYLGEVIKHLKS